MAQAWNDILHARRGPSHDDRGDRRRPVDAAASALDEALGELAALEAELGAGGAPPAGLAPGLATRLARRADRMRRHLVSLHPVLAEAVQFAYHDALTGLPNRALLIDRMQQAMAQATRRGLQVGVLLVDLDGLKSINDGLGHLAGDQVLVRFATLLSACIRKGDTACRYGGDEFVVMLPGIEGMGAMTAVAAKLADRLGEPVEVHGRRIRVSASMGMALYPAEAATLAQALQRADAAMYRMKSGAVAARANRPAAASPATPGWRSPAGRSP